MRKANSMDGKKEKKEKQQAIGNVGLHISSHIQTSKKYS